MIKKPNISSILLFILVLFVLIWSNQPKILSILIGLFISAFSLLNFNKFNKNIQTLLFLTTSFFCTFFIEFLNTSYAREIIFSFFYPLIFAILINLFSYILLKKIFKKDFPILLESILFFLVLSLIKDISISFLLNYFIMLGINLTFWGLTKSIKISSRITIILSFLIGLINSYVIRFRGSAITWADLKSIQTAVNVANNYDYSLTHDELLIFVMMILLFIIVGISSSKINLNLIGRISLILPGILLIILISATNFTQIFGVTADLFHKQSNGLLLNQLLTIDSYNLKLPDDYTLERIKEIDASVISDETEGIVPKNIISIMNESFSDLSFSNTIETPNIDNINENVIKGTLYSSVIGGKTANSEYEFLTNNTMAFMNAELIPYMLDFINEDSPSIAKQLGSLGYETVAFHPWDSSGWNRTNVYNYLGFDKQVFIEDIHETYEEYNSYPTDKWNYEKIIEMVENKTSDKLFIHNITMQNHSPYIDYNESIQKSDESILFLLEYFKNIDEPTMIIFWGDHQPKMDDEFYKKYLGKSLGFLDAEEKECVYEVPFFIWTNYDIEEQENINISINYLSILALETANIPLNKYQLVQKELMDYLPVIHATGLWDIDGEYYEGINYLSDDLKEKINKYKLLQYHNMLDTDNLVCSLFDISLD